MTAKRQSPPSSGAGRLAQRSVAHVLRIAALLAAVVAARPALALEPDLGQVVSRLPQRVQFVAAMDDGARLRRSLGDSPIMMAVASVPRPAKVMDAWSHLASDLGMTDAEAFDLLLGRRVVFAVSGLQAGDAEPQWALLSELDPLTERRLRADLGAVPRRIIDGQPVLELEHGSFLLATSAGRLRCTSDGRFETTPASTIMLLAPAEDRELFDEMLPLLHCRNPEATLAQTPGGAAAAGLTAKDAVFLWRLPDPASAPDRFVAGTVGLGDEGWDVRAIAGPPVGWLPDTELAGLETWAPSMLATLPGDPALAVIGMRELVREAQAWIVPVLSPGVPESDLEALDSLLGDRSMLALWLSPDQEGADPRAEVLVAHQASDIEALARRSEELMGGVETPQPSLLQPHPPFQVRSMRIPTLEELAAEPHPGQPRTTPRPRTASPLSGAGPTLHWTCVAEAGGLGRAGWLVVHFDPTGEAGQGEEPRQVDASIGQLPPRRYLHVGKAQPDRLTERATLASSTALGAAVTMSHAVLSRIGDLEWAVWVDESGRTLEAHLSLRAARTSPPAQ